MTFFSFEVESYRAFRDKAVVAVRPLTMFYGFNQSGKSTLLRLLPILADSIYEKQGPWALNCAAQPSSLFKELGWLGREPSLSPKIGLVAEGLANSRFEVQFSAAEDGLIANRLRLSRDDGTDFEAAWDHTVTRSAELMSAVFVGTDGGDDWNGVLDFESFFPGGLPKQAEEISQTLKDACKVLKRVQWLRANRIDDNQGGDSKQRPIRCCRSDGSDLAKQIVQDSLNDVLQPVNAWLEAKCGVLPIGVGQDKKLSITTSSRTSLPFYLAGEGVRSLVPILLAASWADTKDARCPTMLAIEEPETHLHPHLQVALFDRLLETVQNGIPVALETHSVYMLRAMQLAVLDGRLSPQDVGLYWMSQDHAGAAAVQSISVQNDATLHDWRPDIFEKEQELAHQIMEKRWENGSGN